MLNRGCHIEKGDKKYNDNLKMCEVYDLTISCYNKTIYYLIYLYMLISPCNYT